jgi:hypothetical protein
MSENIQKIKAGFKLDKDYLVIEMLRIRLQEKKHLLKQYGITNHDFSADEKHIEFKEMVYWKNKKSFEEKFIPKAL